jgi:hypothetical protein
MMIETQSLQLWPLSINDDKKETSKEDAAETEELDSVQKETLPPSLSLSLSLSLCFYSYLKKLKGLFLYF